MVQAPFYCSMARSVQSTHEFTFQRNFYSLEKEKFVVRCDDGAVYEFGRPTDGRKTFELIRRFQPDGELSTSNGVLPAAVVQAANERFGESGWSK